MLKPRDGEMEYKDIKDLGFYYMFLAACLSESESKKLKEMWLEKGGVKHMPWYQFIAENVTVNLNQPKIPVVTTYSFDSDTEVVLCSSDEEAEQYLKQSFEKEVDSDIENGWDCISEMHKDYRQARITNRFSDREDVTEFTIGHIYERSE